MVGGQPVAVGQRLEIPYGCGSIMGRVAYDECRGSFKLVTRSGYWVVLKQGDVARLLREV